MFPTLRFVKLSVQRTAARRQLQKWLLLACRVLLLALLIWAVAQPVRRLTGGWLGSSAGGAAVAAVVVDTSYSMQLTDGGTTLLAKADAAVQDLLRGPLAGAKVAVFTSRSNGPAEGLRDASAVLADWSPLQPQPATVPLVDRATAAAALLDRQPPGPRWLVVVSDFQASEFPRAVPQAKDARTVLLDVHPAHAARSAGVTRIAVAPQQPIPGLPAEVSVDVTGPPGDPRAVRLTATGSDGKPLAEVAPAMVTPDATGRGTARFPLVVPAERFTSVTAELTADDAMAWDDRRTQVVEVPPRQQVVVVRQPTVSPGERFVRLALDPSEGAVAQWPLSVHAAAAPAATDDVAVAVLSRWPAARQAAGLRDFAAAGHTVVLFLTPGMEAAWPGLPADDRDALAALLPSAPLARPAGGAARAVVADGNDPLLAGLTDEKFELGNKVIVRRLVPLAADGPTRRRSSTPPRSTRRPGQPDGGDCCSARPVGRGVVLHVRHDAGPGHDEPGHAPDVPAAAGPHGPAAAGPVGGPERRPRPAADGRPARSSRRRCNTLHRDRATGRAVPGGRGRSGRFSFAACRAGPGLLRLAPADRRGLGTTAAGRVERAAAVGRERPDDPAGRDGRPARPGDGRRRQRRRADRPVGPAHRADAAVAVAPGGRDAAAVPGGADGQLAEGVDVAADVAAGRGLTGPGIDDRNRAPGVDAGPPAEGPRGRASLPGHGGHG